MLIVSKFQDYYDAAIAHGVDKKVVYNRKTEELGRDKFLVGFGHSDRDKIMEAFLRLSSQQESRWTKRKPGDWEWEIGGAVVGFCGKLYPAVWVEYHLFSDQPGVTEYFWTQETALDALAKLHGKGVLPALTDSLLWSRRWFLQRDFLKKATYDVFFKEETWKPLLVFFEKNKTPIFKCTSVTDMTSAAIAKLSINPSLKETGFGRVLEAHAAFQEISMFLPALAPVEKMVKIEDKYLAASKGFNKASFRREPGTPDRKRKKGLK